MELESLILILIIIGVFIAYYAMLDFANKQKKQFDDFRQCFDEHGNLIDTELYNKLIKQYKQQTEKTNYNHHYFTKNYNRDFPKNDF